MRQRVNFLSEDMRPRSAGSSGSWTGMLAAILITAVISGSAVYFFQKKNIELAKAALKERDSLRVEILSLKKQVNENTNNDNNPTTPTGPQAAPSSTVASSTPTDNTGITSDDKSETGPVTYEFKYAGLDKTSKYWEPMFTAVSGTQKIILNRKAAETLSKNKETVSNFFAALDPKNQDVLHVSSFVATSSKQYINYVYSYNIKSGDLKRIYQKQANLILKILGTSDGKIVFAAVKSNASLGQCFSLWAGHEDTPYYYLDTTGAKPDVKSFSLLKERIEQGRQEEAECLSKKTN